MTARPLSLRSSRRPCAPHPGARPARPPGARITTCAAGGTADPFSGHVHREVWQAPHQQARARILPSVYTHCERGHLAARQRIICSEDRLLCLLVAQDGEWVEELCRGGQRNGGRGEEQHPTDSVSSVGRMRCGFSRRPPPPPRARSALRDRAGHIVRGDVDERMARWPHDLPRTAGPQCWTEPYYCMVAMRA